MLAKQELKKKGEVEYICLTEKDIKTLERVRKKVIENKAKVKLLNEQTEKLKERIEETNKRMLLL